MKDEYFPAHGDIWIAKFGMAKQLWGVELKQVGDDDRYAIKPFLSVFWTLASVFYPANCATR